MPKKHRRQDLVCLRSTVNVMASQKPWFLSYVIVNHHQSPISLCTHTALQLTGLMPSCTLICVSGIFKLYLCTCTCIGERVCTPELLIYAPMITHTVHIHQKNAVDALHQTLPPRVRIWLARLPFTLLFSVSKVRLPTVCSA